MLMSMQLCGTDEVRDAIENGDLISLILTKRDHGNQEVDEIISMAEKSEILVIELKKLGIENCRIEGKDSADWKLVDAHDIIVHIFHPEKREFYDLEKMWSEEIPKEKAMI